MSELPQVPATAFVERQGVLAVATIVNNARCIWRETLERDIGIDGDIEYVTAGGMAPGRLVGVQVKSGASRFAHASSDVVPFTPEEKHRRYWAEYPLPVILVMHNHETSETIWTDARAQLRANQSAGPILLPRQNVFDETGVLRCLESDGPLPVGQFDAEAVARDMAVGDEAAQGLCFLYLFAQGMTDIADAIWFSMDLVNEILDALAADHGIPSFAVGPMEFAFIDRYIDFLVANDLARVDYGSWVQSRDERQLVGKFIAPLTSKGRSVRDVIASVDRDLGPEEDPHAVAIRERFVQMLYNPMGYDEFGSRHRRLRLVRQALDA